MRRRPTPESADRAGHALLVSSTLGAVNTANARKPLSRTGRASVLSFFPGWLTSELPLHVIGWQALATLGFVRRGALRSPKGWAALALNAASWGALVKIWQESTRAGAVLETALEEGLGDDLVEGQIPGVDTTEAALVRKRIVAGPVARYKTRYVQSRNIAYGDAGRRNQLDIWRRADLPLDGKAPVLLQVHGGAWIIGNKEQQALPLLAHMAENGWVCVSINYRLSPRATWPDHIIDVKRALAWIKANIADHGGDPDFVAITGGSAGGHLSSLAALTPNEPMFQPGFEAADTSVVAAVPFYGVYDWTNRDGTGRSDMDEMLGRVILKTTKDESPQVWSDASTMSWISPDAPPFFVIHGVNDSLVPVEQARSFVAMLRAESKRPVAYAELPGAQHAFEVFDSNRTILTRAPYTGSSKRSGSRPVTADPERTALPVRMVTAVTRLGYQIPNFTYPDVAPGDLFGVIKRQAVEADTSGFDTVMVMDHFYQLPMLGPPEHEMLECYTLLSALAQHTSTVRLGALVTGNTYRNPTLLAKTVTALDVVSGGRAQLGIGAGWFQEEHDSLGFEFGTFTDRFEKLEEALQIILGMFAGEKPSLDGKWYQVTEAVNSPMPLGKIPIMIGGSGEKKTLRLVAQYADESNLTCPIDEVPRKLEALAGHCARLGRDRSEITVSVMGRACVAPTHDQAKAEVDAALGSRGLDLASMSEEDAENFRALIPYGDPDEIGEIFSGYKVDGVDGLAVSAPANGHIEGRVALLGEALGKVFD